MYKHYIFRTKSILSCFFVLLRKYVSCEIKSMLTFIRGFVGWLMSYGIVMAIINSSFLSLEF